MGRPESPGDLRSPDGRGTNRELMRRVVTEARAHYIAVLTPIYDS